MTWQCLTPEYRLKVTFFHTLTRQRVPSWKSCRGPKAKFGQLPFPELGTSLVDLQLWSLRSTWIGLVIYWAIPYETLPYAYIRKKVFQNKTKTHKTRLCNIDKQKQRWSEKQFNGTNSYQKAYSKTEVLTSYMGPMSNYSVVYLLTKMSDDLIQRPRYNYLPACTPVN